MSTVINPEILKKKIKGELDKRRCFTADSELERKAAEEYLSKYGIVNESFEGSVNFREFLYDKISHMLREDGNGFNE